MNTLSFPDELLYHKEHTWLKMLDDKTALVGISNFAQEQLGEVAYVDLPMAQNRFVADVEFGTVESVKAVNALYMPVSGVVMEINENLATEPSLVNASPYDKGWMLKIVPDPGADMEHLMTAAEYSAHVRSGSM